MEPGETIHPQPFWNGVEVGMNAALSVDEEGRPQGYLLKFLSEDEVGRAVEFRERTMQFARKVADMDEVDGVIAEEIQPLVEGADLLFSDQSG